MPGKAGHFFMNSDQLFFFFFFKLLRMSCSLGNASSGFFFIYRSNDLC